jgi:hypothetical protein
LTILNSNGGKHHKLVYKLITEKTNPSLTEPTPVGNPVGRKSLAKDDTLILPEFKIETTIDDGNPNQVVISTRSDNA